MPSLTSFVKTHTRHLGSGQEPSSASTTAWVIAAVTAARRLSLYWPSGTWQTKRSCGACAGALRRTSRGRWTKTMRAFGPSRWSVNSLVLEQQVGDPAQQLALVLVERAPSGMYASHIGIVCCLLPDSWCLLSSRSLRDGAGASERLAELAVIGIVARAS